jgi:tetratricopeptide (TPR) repeat protein
MPLPGEADTGAAGSQWEALLGELGQRVAAAAGGDTRAVLSEEALAVAERLAQASVTPSGEWPAEVLHGIALLRAMRFLCGGGEDERLTAIRLLAELRLTAPELAPEGLFGSLGAGAADGLAVLGADLLRQAQARPDRHLLDRAVNVLGMAADTTPADDTARAGRLSNLGLAFRLRSDRHGADADLDRAVAAGEASVSASPDGDAARAGCLANLADSLHARFERDGDAADLENALAAYRAAVAAAQPGHPHHGVALGKLGAALASRFTVSGRTEDLDEAIRLSTRAAAETADSEFYPQVRTNLGSALAMRGTWTGSRADLEGGIIACRDAVEATAPGEAAASTRWLNLAAALHDRYQLLGAGEDLDGAIAAARSALYAAAAAEDSPVYLAMLFADVSNLLRIRGDLNDDRADLESALASARQALARCPEGHAARADRVNNLGTALLSWFDHHQRDGTVRLGDLEEGIAALTEAVVDTAPGPGQATLLSTLGLLLLRRFEHGGDAADLTAALDAAAAAAYPPQHPAIAGAALNLGSVYRAAFELRRDDAELAGAIRSWRAGVLTAASPATLRLACARQWAELAATQGAWDLAAEAYDHAVALLPLVSWRGLGRAGQEHGLLRQAPVASEAAAAFLGAGQPGGAVAQLEHGRAVLWTQQLAMRDSLEVLRTSQPALAASLDRVRHALDADASALTPASGPW